MQTENCTGEYLQLKPFTRNVLGFLSPFLFSLLLIYLQLEVYGVPGVLGAHVRVQEHKLDQEIFLVYNHAVATQQRHKFVRV